ncbi:ABC transporter ATP-binding protein [Phytoactinopolyspora limicola]|uniref:ABC transporter ATP-binding protein n=1 Tax=Phytoactinopolyspora limicola TaxID=2715536 RepID=UPI001407BCCD|nr:ABC transporter ATP-binding protein [Phytoactinopolyspora limicola]
MSDVLEFADVTLVRSGNRLLDGINWRVSEGERWVILGPNGAGKTTLLQIAATNMHPTSGYVSVLGEVLGGVDVFELRPRIGLTSAALAERIRGSEWVLDVVRTAAYGVLGTWRESYEDLDDSRALGLLVRLGIAHLAGRTFGTLSEGERKRTQIARAMMSDPELLLLDEPTAGLDLGGRETLVAALSEIAADPVSPTTVLVTHHVEEIPAGITHAMLLRSGRVVASGPIGQTLTPDNLAACFGVSLDISHQNGRWSARASARNGG